MSLAMDPRKIHKEMYAKVSQFCIKSAEALDRSKIDWKPHGEAHSPVDILRHIIVTNHVFIKGFEEQAELSEVEQEGIRASLRDYDEVLSELKSSSTRLIEAIGSIDPDLLQENGRPDMSPGSWLQRLSIATIHITYHWGQLNYIQTMYGDTKMHEFGG